MIVRRLFRTSTRRLLLPSRCGHLLSAQTPSKNQRWLSVTPEETTDTAMAAPVSLQVQGVSTGPCRVTMTEGTVDECYEKQSQCCLHAFWEEEFEEAQRQQKRDKRAVEKMQKRLHKAETLLKAHQLEHKLDEKESRFSRLAKLAAVVIGVFITAKALAWYLRVRTKEMEAAEKDRTLLMKKSQLKLMKERLGYVYSEPVHPSQNHIYIPRPDVEEAMEKVISKIMGQYYIFVGEKGTGKSSALGHVLHGREGIVFVEIPEECSERFFVECLCAALGVDTRAFLVRDPRDQFEMVMDWFEEVATELRDEGKVCTLVLDDMNFLAKEASAIIPPIQNRFKRLSTKRIASCVGVVSEPLFLYRSITVGETVYPPFISETRAEVSYVGEMDHLNARALLEENMQSEDGHIVPLSESDLEYIVANTGVYAQHLVTISARMRRGVSAREAVDQLFQNECNRLRNDLPLNSNLQQEEESGAEGAYAVDSPPALEMQRMLLRKANLYEALLTTERLPRVQAAEIAGSPEVVEAGVSSLILAMNPLTNTVGFQSKLMRQAAADVFKDPGFKRTRSSTNAAVELQDMETQMGELYHAFTRNNCQADKSLENRVIQHLCDPIRADVQILQSRMRQKDAELRSLQHMRR